MRYQRGTAVLTAMLFISIVVVALASVLRVQQDSIQRTQSLQSLAQLHHVEAAFEAFAAKLLVETKQDSERDDPEVIWTTVVPELPLLDSASVGGCVLEQSGKLNLNNLWRGGETPGVNPVYDARLRNLLTSVDLSEEIADAIIDWIDPDQVPRGLGGAEDERYAIETPAYRAANQPIQSLSELGLIAGLKENPEGLAALLPHVSALPQGSHLNVNFATDKVIQSLAPHLSDLSKTLTPWSEAPDWKHCGPIAEDFASAEFEYPEGYQGPFDSAAHFLQAATIAASGDEPEKALSDEQAADLSVRSDYFLYVVSARQGALQRDYYALWWRDEAGMRRLWRSEFAP